MLNRDSIEEEEEEERRCYISAREQPDADLRRYSTAAVRESPVERKERERRVKDRQTTRAGVAQLTRLRRDSTPSPSTDRVWREVERGQIESGVAWYESSLVSHKRYRADNIPISRAAIAIRVYKWK